MFSITTNKIRPLVGAIGLGLALLTSSVHANDSTAVMAAGGLVFTKSDSIIMEEEDLFISQDKIRVAYRFRNTSNKPITTRVAFPLPELSANDEFTGNIDPTSKNPMNFSVTVDGKKLQFDTERKKLGSGEDISYKITHHWMQTFPANKTLSVIHTYRPGTGGAVDFEMHDERDGRFCIEPSLQKWIDDLYKKGQHTSTSIVQYILTTGANWKGPIGKFRLTVKKADAKEKLSFCGTGIKKVDDLTFVMEKTNFTPEHDLNVLYLHPYGLD